MKFDRHVGSSIAKLPVKFQSYTDFLKVLYWMEHLIKFHCIVSVPEGLIDIKSLIIQADTR